jgi:ribosomal protein S1
MSVSVGDILDASVIEHLRFGTSVRLPDGTQALLELPFISKDREEVALFRRDMDRGHTVPVVVILVDRTGGSDGPRVAVSMLPEHFDIGERWDAAKQNLPVGTVLPARVMLVTADRAFVDVREDFHGVIRREENPDGVARLATLLADGTTKKQSRTVEVEVIGHDDEQAEFILGYRKLIGKTAPRLPFEQLELPFSPSPSPL